MLRALLYLRGASLRNAAASRLLRLREPRYLLGAAAGLAYVYFFIVRRLSFGENPTGSLQGATSVAWMAALGGTAMAGALILGRAALGWVFPAAGGGLRFTEAEVCFLFTAPISRRTLVHFRLLAAQAGLVLTAVFMAVLWRRLPGGSAEAGVGLLLLRVAGLWLFLATLHLHATANGATYRWLTSRGRSLWPWRVAAAVACTAYILALVWALATQVQWPTPAALSSPRATEILTGDLLASPIVRLLLLPIRVAAGPVLAADCPGFLRALPTAVLLLWLHYRWIMRLDIAFDEDGAGPPDPASASAPASSSSTSTSLTAGVGPGTGEAPPKAAPAPASELFRLSPTGWPEVAFLWKNLLSMRTGLASRRSVILLLVIAFWAFLGLRAMLSAGSGRGGSGLAPAVAAIAGLGALYTLLVGPQFARQDLRSDLSRVDLLKSYPLEGWRIALGEILAPTLVLSAVLLACLGTAGLALGASARLPAVSTGVRATIGLCAAASTPPLCLIQLLGPNALLLLFPAWHATARPRSAGGPEVFGQRLILGVVQLVVAVLAIVPAAAGAGIVFLASSWLVGPAPALALATAAFLAVIASEAAAAIAFLGWRLDRLDVPSDVR